MCVPVFLFTTDVFFSSPDSKKKNSKTFIHQMTNMKEFVDGEKKNKIKFQCQRISFKKNHETREKKIIKHSKQFRSTNLFKTKY